MKIFGMIIRSVGLCLLVVAFPLRGQTVTVNGQSGGSVEVSVSPGTSAIVLDGKLCVVADVEYTFTLTPTNPDGAGWSVVNGGPVTKSFTQQQAGGPVVPIQESSARFKFVRNQPGMAEEESSVTISVTVIKVDIEINNTASVGDDGVPYQSVPAGQVDLSVLCRAKLLPSMPNATLAVTLRSPSNKIKFGSSTGTTTPTETHSLTLPAAGAWSDGFRIYGNTASSALNDASVTPVLGTGSTPVINSKNVTVFKFGSPSLTVQAVAAPAGLYEVTNSGSFSVKLESSGLGVNIEGHATLSPTGLSPGIYEGWKMAIMQDAIFSDQQTVVEAIYSDPVVLLSSWPLPGSGGPASVVIPEKIKKTAIASQQTLMDMRYPPYPERVSSPRLNAGDATKVVTSDTPNVILSKEQLYTSDSIIEGRQFLITYKIENSTIRLAPVLHTYLVAYKPNESNPTQSKIVPLLQKAWPSSAIAGGAVIPVASGGGSATSTNPVITGQSANDYMTGRIQNSAVAPHGSGTTTVNNPNHP